MVSLADLWLPVLASAVAVFVVSSLIHMVIGYHKSDWKKLADEDGVRDDLRKYSIPTGQYTFPCAASMKDMGSPEMLAKLNEGPVGHMTILPSGPWPVGKSLLQWFVFTIVVGVFIAYIATLALPAGADYMAVFRFTGTVAVLAYAFANVPDSIWKGVSWTTTAKFVVDGVLYGLATAGCFGWLWPGAGS